MKRLRITVEGVSYDVEVELLEDDEVTGYGAVPGTSSGPMLQSPSPVSSPRPTPTPASSPPAASTASRDGADSSADGKTEKELTSPIAGILVEVKVKPGDLVKVNDPVVVIEAMKMNTNVHSPVAGKVKEIRVKAGEAVQQGHVLMTFE